MKRLSSSSEDSSVDNESIQDIASPKQRKRPHNETTHSDLAIISPKFLKSLKKGYSRLRFSKEFWQNKSERRALRIANGRVYFNFNRIKSEFKREFKSKSVFTGDSEQLENFFKCFDLYSTRKFSASSIYRFLLTNDLDEKISFEFLDNLHKLRTIMFIGVDRDNAKLAFWDKETFRDDIVIRDYVNHALMRVRVRRNALGFLTQQLLALDADRKGYITISDFVEVNKRCGIRPFLEKENADIIVEGLQAMQCLSEIDRNMTENKKINYVNYLSLLRVEKPIFSLVKNKIVSSFVVFRHHIKKLEIENEDVIEAISSWFEAETYSLADVFEILAFKFGIPINVEEVHCVFKRLNSGTKNAFKPYIRKSVLYQFLMDCDLFSTSKLGEACSLLRQLVSDSKINLFVFRCEREAQRSKVSAYRFQQLLRGNATPPQAFTVCLLRASVIKHFILNRLGLNKTAVVRGIKPIIEYLDPTKSNKLKVTTIKKLWKSKFDSFDLFSKEDVNVSKAVDSISEASVNQSSHVTNQSIESMVIVGSLTNREREHVVEKLNAFCKEFATMYQPKRPYRVSKVLFKVYTPFKRHQMSLSMLMKPINMGRILLELYLVRGIGLNNSVAQKILRFIPTRRGQAKETFMLLETIYWKAQFSITSIISEVEKVEHKQLKSLLDKIMKHDYWRTGTVPLQVFINGLESCTMDQDAWDEILLKRPQTKKNDDSNRDYVEYGMLVSLAGTGSNFLDRIIAFSAFHKTKKALELSNISQAAFLEHFEESNGPETSYSDFFHVLHTKLGLLLSLNEIRCLYYAIRKYEKVEGVSDRISSTAVSKYCYRSAGYFRSLNLLQKLTWLRPQLKVPTMPRFSRENMRWNMNSPKFSEMYISKLFRTYINSSRLTFRLGFNFLDPVITKVYFFDNEEIKYMSVKFKKNRIALRQNKLFMSTRRFEINVDNGKLNNLGLYLRKLIKNPNFRKVSKSKLRGFFLNDINIRYKNYCSTFDGFECNDKMINVESLSFYIQSLENKDILKAIKQIRLKFKQLQTKSGKFIKISEGKEPNIDETKLAKFLQFLGFKEPFKKIGLIRDIIDKYDTDNRGYLDKYEFEWLFYKPKNLYTKSVLTKTRKGISILKAKSPFFRNNFEAILREYFMPGTFSMTHASMSAFIYDTGICLTQDETQVLAKHLVNEDSGEVKGEDLLRIIKSSSLVSIKDKVVPQVIKQEEVKTEFQSKGYDYHPLTNLVQPKKRLDYRKIHKEILKVELDQIETYVPVENIKQILCTKGLQRYITSENTRMNVEHYFVSNFLNLFHCRHTKQKRVFYLDRNNIYQNLQQYVLIQLPYYRKNRAKYMFRRLKTCKDIPSVRSKVFKELKNIEKSLLELYEKQGKDATKVISLFEFSKSSLEVVLPLFVSDSGFNAKKFVQYILSFSRSLPLRELLAGINLSEKSVAAVYEALQVLFLSLFAPSIEGFEKKVILLYNTFNKTIQLGALKAPLAHKINNSQSREELLVRIDLRMLYLRIGDITRICDTTKYTSKVVSIESSQPQVYLYIENKNGERSSNVVILKCNKLKTIDCLLLCSNEVRKTGKVVVEFGSLVVYKLCTSENKGENNQYRSTILCGCFSVSIQQRSLGNKTYSGPATLYFEKFGSKYLFLPDLRLSGLVEASSKYPRKTLKAKIKVTGFSVLTGLLGESLRVKKLSSLVHLNNCLLARNAVTSFLKFLLETGTHSKTIMKVLGCSYETKETILKKAEILTEVSTVRKKKKDRKQQYESIIERLKD